MFREKMKDKHTPDGCTNLILSHEFFRSVKYRIWINDVTVQLGEQKQAGFIVTFCFQRPYEVTNINYTQ